MKLLFVTPDLPFPPRKGYRLMAYHHIRHLSARHVVDLIAFAGNGLMHTGGLSEWCNRVETVPLSRAESLLNLSLGVLADRPLQVSYFKSARMIEAVDRRLRNTEYDVVIFQLTRMAQYLPDWYRGATVLSMVDPFVLNYERSLAWRPWFVRPIVQTEIRRLQRYEGRNASRFGRVLLVAAADVAAYQGVLQSARLDSVPYGVDGDFFSPPDLRIRQEGMIVFTGNMNYPPNADAVEFFCRDIFPLIREQEPLAELWLVGARPGLRVRKWGRQTRTHVTGLVPDVRPYLRRAKVSVCPIRLAVGTQTKVLEALATGTPVVTTSAGNHGIGAIPGEHLHVADSAKDFAAKVVDLLRDRKWKELSEEGRRFVIENFTWERSVAKLETLLEELHRESTSGSTTA